MSLKSLSNAGDRKASNQPTVGKRLKINGNKYRIHPVYNLYGANKQGEVIHIARQVPLKGNDNNTGYLSTKVRGSGNRKQTGVFIHRFIYECYNGLIPDGMVIDHVNDDKQDNRLHNLQLVTQQQNCKKSAANRDSSFFANYDRRKCVNAINVETNETTHYNSINAAHKHHGINSGIIYMCCQGTRKSGTSKKDGCRYKFEYAKNSD